MASLFMTVDSDDERITAEKTSVENEDEILLGHTVLLEDQNNTGPVEM
jgi:hypothetical protein